MTAPSPRPVAVVTGANRGLGLEIARQLGRQGLRVVVAARDLARGEAAAAALREGGADAVAARLDVTDAASVASLAGFVRERFGRLDVLVNNAGASFDWTPQPTQPSAVDADTLRRTFETNVFGPLALTQALLPLLREAPQGRIVNVSSLAGSIHEIGRVDSHLASIVSPAYQASKATLNALTALLAKELRGTRVKVNSACPGWVDTDGGVPPWLRAALGGNGGAVPVEQGADTPVWLATLPDDGPSGGFFQNRQSVPW
ncbi:MAG TPA: SDR family oxidoreductase [Polyangiaceae bacterium]|nr:SDR family oxidoreductase [Polyangiaceae bacterium]